MLADADKDLWPEYYNCSMGADVLTYDREVNDMTTPFKVCTICHSFT